MSVPSRRRVGTVWVVLGLLAMLGSDSLALAQRRPPQLRPRPRLGRDKALDVLAVATPPPGMKPEEMAVLDFDKSIGFFQGWDAKAAVLCIKDDELKFPGERAPIFIFVSALDLSQFDGAFGGLRRGIYVAVGSGSGDVITIYKFRQHKTPLRKVTTKKQELSREFPEPRYVVSPTRDGTFKLHMYVGKHRYEWTLLEPKSDTKTETSPSRRPSG
ncbi:MAG: hypothetical protein PVH68_12725 [Armatimonadota bacterium]